MRNGMRPIHPGEVLREEFLEPLELSASALARALLVPPNRVTSLINETRAVTADTAMRLARYFGTTSEFWMNLQLSYDLRTEEEHAAKTTRGKIVPHPIAKRPSERPTSPHRAARVELPRPARAEGHRSARAESLRSARAEA